jgi:hypothetical protein
MNVKADDAMCFGRSLKISSSPSLTIAKHLTAFKFFCSTSLFSLKLSLLSRNLGGGLDASSLI